MATFGFHLVKQPHSNKKQCNFKKGKNMNTYKKTILTFGIALTIIPQISNAALDAEGNDLINGIKIAFGSNLGPSHILNPEIQLSDWKRTLANINAYFKKNSTVAGVTDKDLAAALTGVMNANSRLIAEIDATKEAVKTYVKGRTDFRNSRRNTPLNKVNDERTFSRDIIRYRGLLSGRVEQLKDIRARLNTTKAQLAAATFRVVSVSDRENVREVLLAVIDYTQRAITNAINKIGEELVKIKKDEDNMPFGIQ